MRDLEVIDSELRMLAAVRRVCRELGGNSAVHGSGRCAAGRTQRRRRQSPGEGPKSPVALFRPHRSAPGATLPRIADYRRERGKEVQ